MTVCGKPGKTIKLFTHPCHKPWKSLRDSHIPSALWLIISIQFSNPKRSLPQLPIPPTFRLILQLEKTARARAFYMLQSYFATQDWHGLIQNNKCELVPMIAHSP